jgi:predicted RNA-binding Zn ribbon-like protein
VTGIAPYQDSRQGRERVDLSGYADLAVRLANASTEGEQRTCRGGEQDNISTLDGLRKLLSEVEFPDTRVIRSDLDALRGLRLEFRKIFAACAAGNGVEAVDRLNALLIQHPVHPQITEHDGKPWHLHLTQGGCISDRYAAGSAMGLATLLTTTGTSRLGVCASGCGRVFVDTSTNKSRRYCSPRCASTANVPALRVGKRVNRGQDLPSAAV